MSPGASDPSRRAPSWRRSCSSKASRTAGQEELVIGVSFPSGDGSGRPAEAGLPPGVAERGEDPQALVDDRRVLLQVGVDQPAVDELVERAEVLGDLAGIDAQGAPQL